MSLEGIGSGFLNATVAPDTTMINSTMDWIMSKMDQFPIKMSFLFACSMVIGSVVPYIPQYFTIKQTQNTEGFSLYVCLTLLVANILRIMFWFGKRFETALLVQSIVMIFAMFALLELCVRVRNSNLIIQGRRHYFAGGDGAELAAAKGEKSGDTGGGGGGGGGGGDSEKTPAKRKKSSLLVANGAALVDDGHHHHHRLQQQENRTGRSSLSSTEQQQQQLRAVANSTVSSTVIEHIVIPNPHSILTQLPNSVSETTTTTHNHSTSSRSQPPPQHQQTTVVSTKAATQSSSQPINSSTVSLSNSSSFSPSSSSSSSSPSTVQKANGSHQQHQHNTQKPPKNATTASTDPLCAATLSHSSTVASSSASPSTTMATIRNPSDPKQPKQTDNGIDTAEVVVDCPADVYCSGDTAAENDGASLLEKKDSKKSCGGGGQMATVKYSTEEEDTRVQVEYQQQGAKSPPKATSPTTSAAAATVVPEHLQVVTVSVADELPAKRHFLDFDFRYFWEWTDFISYLECMAIFAFFTGLVMFFFINEPLVVESYGFVALVTESLLASPQFYRNYKSKSTEGMSRMMVFTWFLGDLYKTIYFVTRSAPFQFLLCGFTQITFDCLIFLQILYYKKVNYRMLSKSRAAAAKSAPVQEEVAMNKLD